MTSANGKGEITHARQRQPQEFLSLSTRIVALPHNISCDLSGEAVVLNLTDGTYYSLNRVAANVWDFVQEPCTLREVLDHILSEYDVEESACTRDLLKMVEQLHDLDLIQLSSQNGDAPQ